MGERIPRTKKSNKIRLKVSTTEEPLTALGGLPLVA
jgi:hypothetical protein